MHILAGWVSGRVLWAAQHRDESFQAITCTGAYKSKQRTENTVKAYKIQTKQTGMPFKLPANRSEKH